MDIFNNQEKKRELEDPIKLSYEEKQNISWNTLENFHETSQVKTGLGAKYSEFDGKDMFALRDLLLSDNDHKSKSFKGMSDAVNQLLNLARSKGKYVDEGGKNLTKDFFEALYAAKDSVNLYLEKHAGYRWQSKGERRVQIAMRLKSLLNGLNSEVKRVQNELPAEKARRVDYARENLTEEEIQAREEKLKTDRVEEDMLAIVETGEFGKPLDIEADKKARENWVIVGYSQELKELVKGSGAIKVDKQSKNDFLAFLMDQNNRLVANRMAISILANEGKKITHNMPWLKKELSEYIFEKMGQEGMLMQTTDFLDKAKEQIKHYRLDNLDRLEKLQERAQTFSHELHVPLNSANLYEYPAMKQLLTESDDQEFAERLQSLKENTRVLDKEIGNVLKEQFSLVTRRTIAKKLVRNLGSLRVFGSREQVMGQMSVFLDMLKYTAPEEYMTEEMLKNVMKDLKIPGERRDHFINQITDGHPEYFTQKKDIYWEARGRQYAENVAENDKSYTKLCDRKDVCLTLAQWEELEKLQLENGIYSNKAYKELVKNIIQSKPEGQKLSRKEYISKRNFKDAQKEPARQKKIAAEQARIDKLGNSMDSKFLVQLSGDGSNVFEPYRRLDAAFKGNTEKLKAKKEEEKRLLEERENDLYHTLQRGGVPKAKWKELKEKFRLLLSDIREITEDMNEDEKLAVQRANLEHFGVRTWDEAMNRLQGLAMDFLGGNPESVIEAKSKYQEGLYWLKSYDGGKYWSVGEFLVEIPEVYDAMMNKSEAEFEVFLKDTVDKKLQAYNEAMRQVEQEREEKGKGGDRSIITEGVIRQFGYSYIRNIYEGKISGDAQFFENQLINYNEKVFSMKVDGENSIRENIKEIEKELDKWLKAEGRTGPEAFALKVGVLGKIYELSNTTENFEKLLDRKELTEFARQELAQSMKDVLENAEENNIYIENRFKDEKAKDSGEREEKIESIKEAREEGRKQRSVYLAIDTERLSNVQIGKTLVRVEEKGRRGIKLNTAKADNMRGRIQKYCSNYELPSVLRDALVEEGCSEAFSGRITSVMWSNSKLRNHASAMSRLYNILTSDSETDNAMSSEEAQMYIVRLYGDMNNRSLFDEVGKLNITSLRSSPEYKIFRENYRYLMDLENKEYESPHLERERLKAARNLRTIMVTDIGILDKDGKSYDED
ncbi:MAG: hypothetical protein K5989_07240, partial [Lachnospiraceae bacterium]|nr:hypothetical protein [Lachnospiraceae bacterium]